MGQGMIDPSLALQTGVRSTLIASPSVTGLVDEDHIRSGSTRPESVPCIILSGGQTQFLGNAAGSQYTARTFLDIHIWALEDGADTAKAIGFAVCNALKAAPPCPDCEIDEFGLPSVRWMRDPNPELSYAHGVITVEAVIRWSV